MQKMDYTNFEIEDLMFRLGTLKSERLKNNRQVPSDEELWLKRLIDSM